MECPKCRLINPNTAIQCDCGYVFATGRVETPIGGERARPSTRGANSDDYSGHCWQDKSRLVVDQGVNIADRCVKCNSRQGIKRWPRKFSYAPPILYFLLFGGVMPYFIVAMIVQKTARMDLGLCERHIRERRNHILASWLMVVVGFCLFAFWHEPKIVVIAGIILFAGGIVNGVRVSASVSASKIDENRIWLRGVSRDFLGELPSWRGR
jgi:hypothetical protein